MAIVDNYAGKSAGGAVRLRLLVSGAITVVTVIAIGAAISPPDHQRSSAESYPIRIPFAAMQSHSLPSPGSLGASPALTYPDRQLIPRGGRRDFGKRAEIGKRFVAPEFIPPVHMAGGNSTADKSMRRGVGAESAGILWSNFDLGAGSSSPEGIEIRKPVLLNGQPAGTVLIRIGTASQVFVSRKDITSLLPRALTSGLSGEFVTLDQVRKSGVTVQYDPAANALLITM
jgi:hypothetical protein